MSPRRNIPASTNPSLPLPKKPKQHSLRKSHTPKTPPQSMLWQFIKKQICPVATAPMAAPISSQTVTPRTQGSTATPLAQQLKQDEISLPNEMHQLILQRDDTNLEWGDCDQYNKPHDFLDLIKKREYT